MSSAGINDVESWEVEGQLSDHYDPSHKRLALSTDNYRGTSLAALGVSAHEAGHAITQRRICDDVASPDARTSGPVCGRRSPTR